MLADPLREMNARRVVLFFNPAQDGGPIEALQRVAQGRAMMAMARHHAGLGSEGITLRRRGHVASVACAGLDGKRLHLIPR